MLKRVLTIVIAYASLVALADTTTLEMVLLNAIPSDSKDGLQVSLQSPGQDRCKFVGTLGPAIQPGDGFADKFLTMALGSERIINISLRECAGRVDQVAFAIPLGRMSPWPGPDTGTRFKVEQPK